MKTINVRELQKSVRECVETAQSESVVVTRHGRPTAVVIGVEGLDWEGLTLATSKSFWRMIQRRRKQKTIPVAEARKRLGI